MNKIILKSFSFFLSLFFLAASLNAADTGHRGEITALIHKGDTVISAGEDGFIVIWNAAQRTVLSRFQLTTNKIQMIVSHPQKDEICIVESGGLNNYRISAWDYTHKQKLFSVFSAQPVGFINYSGGGNFIIASGLNGAPLSLLNSVTGNIVSTANIPNGNVTFAMTGRAERNMLIYQSENDEYLRSAGQILYYDIDSREVTGSFQAPSNLSNPVIFGNNRFLAGINSDGLLLVDAASGEVYDTIANMERNTLLCALDDGFYSLRQRGTSTTLNRYTVDRNGRLVSSQQLTLSLGSAGSISAIAHNGSVVFGSSLGNILMLDRQNRIVSSSHTFQTRITEIAAGEQNIAFLTENGGLCFIPLDYNQIQRSAAFTMTQKSGYTKLTPVFISGEERFILWQSDDTRNAPQLLGTNQQVNRELAFLRGRFPLLSISVLNNRLLTLDTGGNITIRSTESLFSSNPSSTADFTFSSIGAIDSSLINNDYFVVSRSVISNNSPFIFINIRTSETVPVSYPAQAGLTVFSGSPGIVFAEAVERDSYGLKTSVLSLPPVTSSGARAGSAVRIFEYRGEASNLSIAESGGNLAIACDSEGALIFADDTIVMERTNGLPVKLLGTENFFLSLDSEGNIAWHDNKTGSLLAVFSLNGNRWTLSSDGREITGSIRN